MDKINELNLFFNMEEFLAAKPFLAALAVNNYPILMIFWNLILLAIPLFLFFLLAKYARKNKFKRFFEKIFGILLFFLWFIFIPNTVYLITDIRHLSDYCPRESYSRICPENAWMIMFFFLYSCLGWIFFVFFLNQMKNFLTEIFSKKIGRIFIPVLIPFISIGVLLGLINRFNSWDILFSPLAVFKTALVYSVDFYYFRDFIVFTASLYLLYYGGNFLFSNKKYGLFKNRKGD